jgi:transposase
LFEKKQGAQKMPGKWITKQQNKVFMQSREMGKSIEVAAAQAGFSERSAYNIENRSYETANRSRSWKTRADPFEAVWQSEVVPLLEASPKLEARTLLEELQRRYPGQYPEKLLRTLQRRVKQWKAVSGPEKEVIFRQNHPPGWQSISDFTNANELGISIRGEPFLHLLYHFRLSFSGHEFAQVVQGGESYSALAEGLQNAFWSIGGVTETHRTDSLSAAYKNLSDKDKEEFTKSYCQFCEHYGVEPTRNNKGESHENGSIESPNGHLKNRLDQALMLRGSRDFDSLDKYKGFLQELMQRQNKRVEKTFLEERTFLKSLPERKTSDYLEVRVRVTTSSTITVKHVIYSVPSRLIGMMLKVHLFDDRLECYVGGDHTITLKRLRANSKKTWLHHIDYRHIIGALVRKPQAFRRYIYRDALYPTFAFRQAWECLDKELDARQACREYVKILNEATQPDGEKKVNSYLEDCLVNGRIPSSDEVKALFKTVVMQAPSLKEIQPRLSDYDVLLNSLGGSL